MQVVCEATQCPNEEVLYMFPWQHTITLYNIGCHCSITELGKDHESVLPIYGSLYGTCFVCCKSKIFSGLMSGTYPFR